MAWSKESRQARGYGRQWELLRLIILRRDCGICHCPDCQGGKLRLRPATEVDHIIPKAQGGTDDESNLRAVNSDCHKRLTLQQRGFKVKQQIGLDGWPVG